jgi:hypothetical protein
VLDQTRIQQETHEFRNTVAGWGEARLRQEGEDRQVPDADTLDLTTLREAIVQHERDRLRADVAHDPILPDSPAGLTTRQG